MAKQFKHLKVFIASPSDVQDERDQIEQAIRDTATSLSEQFGIYLEPVRWETHAHPGVGSSPQDVIDRDIGIDYHIFIGVLWSKFGTPVNDADSGTEHEFNRAYENYQSDPESVSIMMYFKDAPIAPSRLDAEQFAAVKRFQESLGPNGVLWWSFTESNEIDRLLRMHLTRELVTWQNRMSSDEVHVAESSTEARNDSSDYSEDDGMGFIEAVEQSVQYISTVREIAVRMTDYFDTLAERMRSRTEQMNRAGERNDAAGFRVAANGAALDINSFSANVEGELGAFRGAHQAAVDSTLVSSELSLDFGSSSADYLRTLDESLLSLANSLGETIQSNQNFRGSVETLPRLTTPLRKARSKTLGVVDKLGAELVAAHHLYLEAHGTIGSMLHDLEG